MSALYQRLRAAWLASGVPINHGATLPAIELFEKQHSIKLPNQLRDYLCTSNVMVHRKTDQSLISFLPLDEIDRQMSSIASRSPSSVDIIFAEFLVYSHYYVVRATTDGVQIGIFAADGVNEKCVAPCLDDFIVAYLSNPEATANCWSGGRRKTGKSD